MSLDFMTPEVWNGLVLAVIFIGLALAGVRLYADLSRPPDDEQKPPPPPPSRKPAPRPKKGKRPPRRR